MALTVIENLLACPLTPSEMVKVTRIVTTIKKNGAESTTTTDVGEFKAFICPPDTMNKNDGAILERLMSGIDPKKVYMMYMPPCDIKIGDTVYREQTDQSYYEVKVVGNHGKSYNNPLIRHDKCFIVLKDNQKA